MSFAAPWMLAALVAVAVPVWIHIRRIRRETIWFPPAALLARVARHRKPRLRLRSLVLLALRILAILAIVLAASRPGVTVTRPGGIRAGAPLALVAVLDDSLSMRLRGDDGASLFDRAKELLAVELERLRPGDAAALILAGHPARALNQEVTFDLERVRLMVKKAEPSFRSGDIQRALRQAVALLRENPLPQREVLLITDLSDSSWADGKPPAPIGTEIGFRVVDPGPKVARVNTAIDQVRVSPSEEGVSQEVIVEARVTSFGDAPDRQVETVLEVDGVEAARGGLEVPASGSAIKRFHHRFDKEGMYSGVVRIRSDGLSQDDERHFFVIVRKSITVMIIDGDYRPGSYNDEAFYLRRALDTPMPGEAPIRTVVVDAQMAKSAPVMGNDVVFLVGMPEVKGDLAHRLIEYVKGGGGLFVSPAPKGGGLAQLNAILPAVPRSVKQAPRKNRPFRVASINRTHPVFQPFGEDPSGLEGTRVRSHLLVKPEPNARRTTLIELANGLPLLMERPVEKGAVMLLTTTVDREWTDLPIRPGYLPMVQRTARHLAGRLDDRNVRRIHVGRPAGIEVSEGMQRLVVRGPGERDTTYAARDLAGKTRIEYKDTLVPGHYRVWAEIPDFGGMKEVYGLEFVVEPDPAESDPTRIIETTGEDDDPVRFAPIKGQLPIWPYLLVLAMLFVLAETYVGGIGLKRSHVKTSVKTRTVLPS